MIVMTCDKHDKNGGRSCNLLGDVDKQIVGQLQHVHQLGTSKLCMKWLDVVGTTPSPISFWCKWAWGLLQLAKIFQAFVINKPFAWVLFQCHHLFYSKPKDVAYFGFNLWKDNQLKNHHKPFFFTYKGFSTQLKQTNKSSQSNSNFHPSYNSSYNSLFPMLKHNYFNFNTMKLFTFYVLPNVFTCKCRKFKTQNKMEAQIL
jgi:hypothetical protein